MTRITRKINKVAAIAANEAYKGLRREAWGRLSL